MEQIKALQEEKRILTSLIKTTAQHRKTITDKYYKRIIDDRLTDYVYYRTMVRNEYDRLKQKQKNSEFYINIGDPDDPKLSQL